MRGRPNISHPVKPALVWMHCSHFSTVWSVRRQKTFAAPERDVSTRLIEVCALVQSEVLSNCLLGPRPPEHPARQPARLTAHHDYDQQRRKRQLGKWRWLGWRTCMFRPGRGRICVSLCLQVAVTVGTPYKVLCVVWLRRGKILVGVMGLWLCIMHMFMCVLSVCKNVCAVCNIVVSEAL